MVKLWKSIKIKDSTDKYIIEEVRRTFLKHHPECSDMFLSREFLIMKALRYYVEH